MELEREPQRKPDRIKPTMPPSSSQSREKRPQTTISLERVTYAREACYVLGALLITIGLIGFVVTNLAGTHLSYAHNLIHVLSGIGALICAYYSRNVARIYALTFGTVYGLLAVLGFTFGLPGESTTGHVIGRDSSLWVLSPGVLEFGTNDHILHLVIAAVFLISATVHFQKRTVL